jgi:hypothetical protein
MVAMEAEALLAKNVRPAPLIAWPPPRRSRVEEHLLVCQECRELLVEWDACIGSRRFTKACGPPLRLWKRCCFQCRELEGLTDAAEAFRPRRRARPSRRLRQLLVARVRRHGIAAGGGGEKIMKRPDNPILISRPEQASAAFQRIVELLSIFPFPPPAIQEAIALAVMEREHCGWRLAQVGGEE